VKGGRLSRRELLACAATAGAAASAALPDVARAAGAGQAEIVAKALAIELLAVFAYEQVLGLGTLGAAAQQVAEVILAHERAHVRALEAQLRELGGAPSAGPASVAQADAELQSLRSSGRLSGLHGERITLDFLYDIESITLGAHDRVLEKLSDPVLVRTSVEIMGVEAQHAAAIGALLHPGKFDRIVPVNYVKGKT
jgi:rubrerythrin